MRKNLLVSGAVLLLLITAGCSSSSATVASTTSGKITQEQLYNSMKAQYGEETLQTMVIEQVLSDKYGKSVTAKKINAQYDEVAEMYGGSDSFESVLSQYGYGDAAAYKATIKQNLLIEAAVKAKTSLKDADYKELWGNSLHFQTILVADEDTAKEVITKLDDGGKFKTLAAEYSTDTSTSAKSGDAGFYNTETGTTYDTTVIEAANKLKEGEYTKTAIQTDSGYYVVKMIVNPTTTAKSWKDYKSDLKEMAVTANLSDSSFTTDLLSKLLKDANVQIKDDDLKDALAAYLSSSDSSATTSSTSSTATDSTTSSSEATSYSTADSESTTTNADSSSDSSSTVESN